MVSKWQSWGSNSDSLTPEDTAYLLPCTAHHTADTQQIHMDLMLFLDYPIQRTLFLPMSVKTKCVCEILME